MNINNNENKIILRSGIVFLMIASLLFVGKFVQAEAGLNTDINMSVKEKRATVNLQKRNKEMQERVDRAEAKRAARIKNRVCVRLDKMTERLENVIKKRKSFIDNRFNERISELQKRRNSKDEAVKERRAERDRYREKYYEELEKRAQTDEQKKAVEKFKETIENAVKKRRTTIDQAVEDMRKGIDDAIAQRKTVVDNAANSFNNDELSALNKTKNSCNENTNNEEWKSMINVVRENIRMHRDDYKQQLKQAKKVGDVARELAKTKRETIMNAIEEFKTTVKSAQEELRKSFGQTTDEQVNE